MSELDEIISEILNINSQNEAERNEATENLTSRILVPQFLEKLIELIVDSNVQSDQTLFIKTLIVLKACLKYNYSKCEITDENFIKVIPITLIQLLNSIPPQFHLYIIDYFRQINKIVYRRSPYDTNEEFLNSYQESTLPILIEQIKEQTNFVSNLYILRLFIKLYIDEEEENRNEEFFSQILNEILPIFVTVLNTKEINEITAESILIISRIMIKLIDENIIKLKPIFTSQELIEMITNYTNFFNTSFEFSKSLNRYLLKLNKQILLIYEDDNVLTSFMIPYLFELTTKLLIEMDSNTWDIPTRNISLKILSDYYYSGYFEDEINSEDFITSILIPSTKLTEEELNDLSSMPSLISSYFLYKKKLIFNNSNCNNILPDSNLFISSSNNLNFDDSNISTDLTVRPVCRSLASEILKNPELRLIVSQQTEDPIEFESHIFLLSCADPTHDFISPDEIQFILKSAIEDFNSNPPFIQASYIYYLINHISLISDCSTLVELGVYCINNSDDPLVITAAVDLLRNGRLHFTDFENIDEKISIIPKILTFCDAFNFWEPIDVVIKLVKNESNEIDQGFPDLLNELISAIFENCLSIASKPSIERSEFDDFDNDYEFESDNSELRKNFDNIIIIIKDLDITDELISFCLQHCLNIMKEIQHESFYLELFCFVSFFNYLLRDPIDDQFDFIMHSISFNNNIAGFVLNAAYPLILNPQSNIESREEFVSLMAEICQTFINKIINEEEKPDVDVKSILRVCGALIEIFGNNFVSFVEFAFFIFDSDILIDENYQDYFTHLVYVLYNAFMVDPSIVISNLDEKTINYLLGLSINEIACNLSPSCIGPFYRGEVKRHFCLLLEIARIGKVEGNECELLANYADKLFEKTLKISKSFLYATDYCQQYEYMKFNSFLAARYFPTSIDQVDEWKLFFEVAEGAGFQLSDYEMRIIGPTIRAMEENQENQDPDEII